MWATAGGLDRAQQVLRRIVGNVDALFGNEEDLQKGLGIAGPEATAKSKLDPDAFFQMIERVVEQFPNIKMVATTLREVHSTNRHDWAAVLWIDGQRFVSPTCQLDVLDRIGGGDGFASGLIYGLIAGRSPEEALRLGWAHGALLTTFPGDVTMARLDGGGGVGQGRLGASPAVSVPCVSKAVQLLILSPQRRDKGPRVGRRRRDKFDQAPRRITAPSMVDFLAQPFQERREIAAAERVAKSPKSFSAHA